MIDTGTDPIIILGIILLGIIIPGTIQIIIIGTIIITLLITITITEDLKILILILVIGVECPQILQLPPLNVNQLNLQQLKWLERIQNQLTPLLK
tara:strand:+ start:2077 stop:2361 length:285 start_codon:yes stop_codon:yes gene_type:complete